MINLSCKVIACAIILSSVKLEKKVQHSENDIRISHNLLSPSPSLSKDYCIRSFWSQNTEKRNNAISQMRLRSVFKMRMSILNTATTEQMGYGIISFFVCSLMNQIVNYFLFPVECLIINCGSYSKRMIGRFFSFLSSFCSMRVL